MPRSIGGLSEFERNLHLPPGSLGDRPSYSNSIHRLFVKWAKSNHPDKQKNTFKDKSKTRLFQRISDTHDKIKENTIFKRTQNQHKTESTSSSTYMNTCFSGSPTDTSYNSKNINKKVREYVEVILQSNPDLTEGQQKAVWNFFEEVPQSQWNDYEASLASAIRAKPGVSSNQLKDHIDRCC